MILLLKRNKTVHISYIIWIESIYVKVVFQMSNRNYWWMVSNSTSTSYGQQITVSCVLWNSVRQFLSTILIERITSNENEIHSCTQAFLFKKSIFHSSYTVRTKIYDCKLFQCPLVVLIFFSWKVGFSSWLG